MKIIEDMYTLKYIDTCKDKIQAIWKIIINEAFAIAVVIPPNKLYKKGN